MPGCDERRPDILTISITDSHPPIMCPLSVEIAFDRFAAEVIDHPTPRVLPRASAEFRRIDAIEPNRCARDHDRVRIAYLDLGFERWREKRESDQDDVSQLLGPSGIQPGAYTIESLGR